MPDQRYTQNTAFNQQTAVADVPVANKSDQCTAKDFAALELRPSALPPRAVMDLLLIWFNLETQMVSSISASPRKGLAPSEPRSSRQANRVNSGLGSRRAKGNSSTPLVFKVVGVQKEDRKAMLSNVRAGLPSAVVKMLEVAYGSTQSDIGHCLLIPLSTLRRRIKNAERLNVDESDRAVRLARIKDLALDMMQNDDAAAIDWLRTPREILDNESPMMHASTEFGGREVEDLIGRIRHGVFS